MLGPGVLLQERYEILEIIGSGGMADVYKARCHKLDRFVAIKVLKEEFCSDGNFVDKFKMEAQSAAKLSHPNIVNIYDVVDEGNLHYIVMELIEGITLKRYIAKKGRLEEKEAIGIGLQVALGIAAAHEQNIIHRDIKPQNMLISKDGKVKVADFGIARVSTSQTLNTTAVGSVHYISPEQARGDHSDARSDIYSLGITMYEMVTGKVPFEGDNTVVVALAHLETPMPKPSLYQPMLSKGLEDIILRCTEKKPGHRYQDSSQLIQDLRKILLNPEEIFDNHATVEESAAHTIMIGSKEMEQIKRGNIPDGKKEPQPLKAKKDRHESDDENPYLEMLFTGVRILVALLIIIILFFVFSKVANVFKFSSKDNEPETSTAFTISTEADTAEDAGTSDINASEETLNSKEVYMPDLSDMTEKQAETVLKEYNLVMKVTTVESDTIPKGSVVRQEEPVGSVVARFSDVHVVISEGNPMMKVADLLPEGISADTAKSILDSKHIQVKLVEEYHETVKEHMIIRVDPEAVKEGDTVTLYVSMGSEPVLIEVPVITLKPEAEARELLSQAGLQAGEVSKEHNSTVPAGNVIRSDGEGTQVEPGTAISFVVSSGPEVEKRRYIGSIAETYNLSNLIGPGSRGTSVTIMIRLKQHVNGKDVYTTKMQPTEITADTLLPVNFPVVEGAPGIDRGQIEVVEVESGAVLKSYDVTFFPMD